ncbi:MAG: helix-turn-helix domain-containing protein [Polyangia bacterium]|jgi:hypothetical protein
MSEPETPPVRLLEAVPPVAEAGPAVDSDAEQGETLDARELRFVDMVASGSTLGDAATAIGIGYRTARRWKKRPEIASAVKERASEQVALGRAVLAAGMGRASHALVEMADGTATASAPRVSAARAVVEVTAKLVELEDVAARLAELEARLEAKPGHPGQFRKGI